MSSLLRSIALRGFAMTAMFAAGPAIAAPYCMAIQGLTTQCLYVDANQCRIDAARHAGSCVANPAEITLPEAGNFPYCIVGAGYATCKFIDQGSCETEAKRRGGACVQSFAASGKNSAPDPYRDRYVTGR